MAIYTLHYILFTVTKIINLHLLLDESFGVIWSNRHHQRSEISYSNETSFSRENQTSVSIILADSQTAAHLWEHQRVASNALQYQTGRQDEFLYTHSILFITSLFAFLFGSIRSLNQADKTSAHRTCLLRTSAITITANLIYLYTINTLAFSRDQSVSSPTTMKCIHSLIVIVAFGVFQWSQIVTGSLVDSLAVQFCIKQSRLASCVDYQFVTHLVVAAFSAALSSVTLCEIYLSFMTDYEAQTRYTNTALSMAIISSLIEFACLKLFTKGGDESLKIRPIEDRFEPAIKSDKKRSFLSLEFSTRWLPRTVLSMYDSGGSHNSTKATYTLSDNSKRPSNYDANIWSLSAVNLMRSNEMMRTINDEECDNSVELFCIYPGFYNKTLNIQPLQGLKINTNNNQVYDRSKFSLYDDYCSTDEELHRRVQVASSSSSSSDRSHHQSSEDIIQHKQGDMNVVQILFAEWCFIRHIALFVLIGSIYQANQLCFFTDYLRFLIQESPLEFRKSLFSFAQPYLDEDHAYSYQEVISTSQTIWMELICIGLVIQCSARVACLHHVNNLVFKLGTKTTLSVLSLISLTIPIQFGINYAIVQDTERLRLTAQGRLVLILIQQALIQIQVGSIGGLIEFIINDLTLHYAQHVANYRSSKLAKIDNMDHREESVQCNVHGILSGSFNLLGTAVMSATSLLSRYLIEGSSIFSKLSTFSESLLCIGPASILLASLSWLFMIRWKLSSMKQHSDRAV